MKGKDIELTRRRVLGGIVTVGGASAAAGAGTFALFSDTEQSTGNTVQAGTLNLEVSKSDTVSFGADVKPGDTSITAEINLTSDGTLSADHLELAFSVNETESSKGGTDGGDIDKTTATDDSADPGAKGMSTLFQVNTLIWDDGTGSNNVDLLSKGNVSDENEGGQGNGITDLDDVVQSGVIDSLPAPSDTGVLTIELTFFDTDDSIYTGPYDDDKFQGDELTVIVDAGLAQGSDQSVLSNG